MKSIKLGNRLIDDNSLYFIADIGANHNGSLEKAKALIHLAKESGADAAKFQNFSANKIVSKQGFETMKGKLSHQSKWKKSVFEIYEDASINKDWTKILKEECDKVGLDYFTSPYDFESVDLVDPFVDLYKIGSGDAAWLEIIEYVLDKGKPTLLATGACDWDDVERMMNLATSKTKDIVLMQCNTNYTGSLENFKYCNLNVLKAYAEKYPDVVLGLSDHTPGHSTVLGSIALGARIIEKHFTDDNNQEGPDHAFAMNPQSWKDMVDRSYELLSALGDGEKRVEENEAQSYIVQRRCLCAKDNLKKGHRITKDDIFPLRPIAPDSFQPYEIDDLIGKELILDIEEACSFTLTNIK
ncbi:N-acetylneuraminate synthase family protein [Labilibaculum sp. DW002]|uniref:N-acetylneuraminate synthase family protein n=1 Tax=Paralabilibaculum antarcticum TaxID=2912572 RepID=A0ABT5VP90_9BACT|nr:N-acetylneuraminate synthase family protein [Labilibaculum sp. DW002]MDE5417228.1 N-acetylneuraminate synthase family protein [Labilibaculum sp. DW002]